MANPICLSPLKFYDSTRKQNHNKSYAYGHVSPLVTKVNAIPSFQLVVPSLVTRVDTVSLIKLSNSERQDITSVLLESGLHIITYDDLKVLMYTGFPVIPAFNYEGRYVISISLGTSDNRIITYYSEVICATNALSDYIELEYWNRTGDFKLKNGVVSFDNNFRFKLYLKTELGKPEYEFEEESTKRLGYTFIESQVSKKVYKFNAILPEYICDAMRIIRLCSEKRIIDTEGEEYDLITFGMEVDWEQQGDLASVNCEFEVDNIIANYGGYAPDDLGGDFSGDFNSDFYIGE